MSAPAGPSSSVRRPAAPKAGVRAGTRAVARDPQAGVATVVLPMLLWVGTLAAIALIDLGAYLTAAARAQALADAVALAAVSAEVEGARALSPIREADRTAMAGGGQLEGCVCTPGTARAAVRVSVSVPGLVLPTLGAARVAADAVATLVAPP